jgi:hypothetical protein
LPHKMHIYLNRLNGFFKIVYLTAKTKCCRVIDVVVENPGGGGGPWGFGQILFKEYVCIYVQGVTTDHT